MANRIRRPMLLVVAVVLVAAAIVGALSLFVDEIPCRYHLIDANSGQLRQKHYVMLFLVEDSTMDTAFSKLVSRFNLNTDRDWRPMGFQGLWQGSPHYRYHEASAMLEKVVWYIEAACLDDACRRRIVTKFLGLLQRGDIDQARTDIDLLWGELVDK